MCKTYKKYISILEINNDLLDMNINDILNIKTQYLLVKH